MSRAVFKVFLVAVACVLVWQYGPFRLHKAVAAEDVVRVELWPKGARQGQPATPEETRQILSWFNAATNIVDNSHHGAPGCGTFSEVRLYLRSGAPVTITSYMRATQGDKDYYFEQPQLKQFIATLDQRVVVADSAPGC